MPNPLTAYQIYVGTRNTTGVPSGVFGANMTQTLFDVLKSPNYEFDGFTITDGKGYWTPDSGATEFWEECKVVTIFIDETNQGHKFRGLINQLIQNLGQAAVGVVRLGSAGIAYGNRTPTGTVSIFDPFGL